VAQIINAVVRAGMKSRSQDTVLERLGLEKI